MHLLRLAAVERAVDICVLDAVLADTDERILDELQSVSHEGIEAARPFSRGAEFNLIGRRIGLGKWPRRHRFRLIDGVIAFEQIVLVSGSERRSFPQSIVCAPPASIAVRLPVCLDTGTRSGVIDGLAQRGLIVGIGRRIRGRREEEWREVCVFSISARVARHCYWIENRVDHSKVISVEVAVRVAKFVLCVTQIQVGVKFMVLGYVCTDFQPVDLGDIIGHQCVVIIGS